MAPEHRKKPPVLLLALPALLLAGLLLWALRPQSPAPTPEETEDLRLGNDRAEVDLSALDQGVAGVCYLGEEARMKVQITKENGKDYNYDLHAPEVFETFPFTEGEGTYTLKVLEHKEDKIYTTVYSLRLKVTLESEVAPFLLPNQFVNYGDAVADLAARVMGPGETDGDRAALAFDYVAETLTYDYDKLEQVEPGYLPDLEAILESGKGICFDYAALLCAMLRSQAIPCKLVVGDSGEVYHAWVEVWCGEPGESAGGAPIYPGAWTRLDPTFFSQSEDQASILAYIADDANYSPVYVY